MKLYFPTTTLNFSNIVSSGSIAPAGCYTEWKLGWNRFVTCEPNWRQDCLLVYDAIPCWRIPKSDNTDYPMCVEVEGDGLTVVAKESLRSACDSVVGSVRIIESPILYANTYRIVFNDAAERAEMLSKMVGVPEFKGSVSDLSRRCVTLEEVQKEGIPTFEWTTDFRAQIDGVCLDLFHGNTDSKKILGKHERITGARIGYLVGCWLKSGDSQILCLNDQDIFDASWLETLKPQEKVLLSSVTELCDKPFPTDDTEKAQLAATWGKFVLSGLDGKYLSDYRNKFNRFLGNLQNPMGCPYSVEEENSPLIQAFAGMFYIIDKDYDSVVRMIKHGHVLKPELLLAFYGAARGYTRFPNILLIRDTYKVVEPTEKRIERVRRDPKKPSRKDGNPIQQPEFPISGEDSAFVATRIGALEYMLAISVCDGTFGVDRNLAPYLVAWAVLHGVAMPEYMGTLSRDFQLQLNRELHKGRKVKKEPQAKSLVKKMCGEIMKFYKERRGIDIEKNVLKLLKADLEMRYARK